MPKWIFQKPSGDQQGDNGYVGPVRQYIENRKGPASYQCKFIVNPIPTGHGQNQPIYERHVTTAGRNRVKSADLLKKSAD